MSYLILEQAASKSPYTTEHKVQLIEFFWTVCWGVFWCEHHFQQIAQHLQVTDVSNGSDLLEAVLHYVQANWYILVKQDGQVGTLGLYFTGVNPTA